MGRRAGHAAVSGSVLPVPRGVIGGMALEYVTGCQDRLVDEWRPYYLGWMSANALRNRAQLDRVREAADRISDPEALCLARIVHWRPLVMGAWFALRHPEAEIAAAILASLTSSLGHLTAPPLAVSAVLLSGPSAMPSLVAYHGRDVAHGYGASELIEAAAGHLAADAGITSPLQDPSESAAKHFAALLDIGTALQNG